MADLPFDDRDGVIWLNGEMVEWREAKTHILCHGLHYGGSVFEGVRVYNGRIFKSVEHAQRLLASGELIDMPLPFTAEEIDKACEAVVAANNVVNGYLRPVAWRGAEEMGIGASTCKTHVAVACWDWPSYFPPELREKGLSLMTTKWRRADPATMPVHSKTAGLYAVGTMAKHEAMKAGYHDVLMLDYQGNVAESSGANLFCVKDGVIHTPIPHCFLNGITRQTVMQLARDKGYEVVERTITPDELAGMDEIFITGTAVEVTPIGKIDDMTFTPGAVTHDLIDAYEALVGK